jgi:hypothetical protein
MACSQKMGCHIWRYQTSNWYLDSRYWQINDAKNVQEKRAVEISSVKEIGDSVTCTQTRMQKSVCQEERSPK